MKPRYCARCGKPIAPDADFCENCGARVQDIPPVQNSQQVYRAPGAMPLDEYAAQDAPQAKKPLTIAIVAIAAALVVVVALIFVFLVLPSHGANQGTEQTASVSEQPATSQEAMSSSTPADATESTEASATQEQEVYTALSSSYDQLAGFDDEIRSCATTFNNTYLSSDLSTRQANANAARDLLDRISNAGAAVDGINVPTASAYAATKAEIATCYDDLENRISVIVQSWDIDLSYSDPRGHEETILAPIEADNVGTVNKYLTDYQQRYPNAKPQPPQ